MQFPMFQTTDELLTVILVIVAFSLWVQRFRIFKYVGPALTVILIGLTLVNLRIVPGYQDVYSVVITYCVPMSISISTLRNLQNFQAKPWWPWYAPYSASAWWPRPSALYLAAGCLRAGKSPACSWGPTPAAVPISPPLQLALTLPMKPLLLPTQRIMSSACPPCS